MTEKKMFAIVSTAMGQLASPVYFNEKDVWREYQRAHWFNFNVVPYDGFEPVFSESDTAAFKNKCELVGYTCKPVICANQETHVAVDKEAISTHIQLLQKCSVLLRGFEITKPLIDESILKFKQFLNAGSESG